MNAEENAKRLLSLIGRLSGVLKEENQRLSIPGRAKGLKEIVVEKETLSRAYEQQIKILSMPDVRENLKPELLARIVEAANGLGILMEENYRRLQAKMEATKLVFKIMAEAAKEFRAASGGYGPTGAVGVDSQQARQAYRPAISLGVNREL